MWAFNTVIIISFFVSFTLLSFVYFQGGADLINKLKFVSMDERFSSGRIYYYALVLALMVLPYWCYRVLMIKGLSKAFNRLALSTFVWLILILTIVPYLIHSSSKEMAYSIKAVSQGKEEVISFYGYPYDLSFYLERTITVVDDWTFSKTMSDNYRKHFSIASQHQDTRKWLIDSNEFIRRWKSNERKFVWVSKSMLPLFKTVMDVNKSVYYIVKQEKNKTVYVNQKSSN